jgi:pimeloyl-ACP methyl ester carboxylesterase/DNA-binding CsgD family transcriptional regulator
MSDGETGLRARLRAAAAPGEADSAAAALHLLDSMSQLSEAPERLFETCADWARLSASAEIAPGFAPLVRRVAGASPAMEPAEPCAAGLAMILDAAGRVEACEPGLAAFAIAPGTDLSNALSAPLAELAADPTARPGEIVAADGSRHLFCIARAPAGADGRQRYLVALCKVTLPRRAAAEIRRRFGLTEAELDVLRLVLQRLDVPAIAALRGNRVNTIRTHINSIIRKFGCHSLNAVITSAFEIAAFAERGEAPSASLAAAAGRRAVALAGGARLVYAEGGAPGGRPVVILHSLEYGHEPPDAFFAAARAAGFRALAPMRPGVGGSTPAPGGTAARRLAEFLDALDLDEAVIVGLSSGAPLALRLAEASPRVRGVVLVNYAFNAGDKLKDVRPAWVAGVVDLVARSRETARLVLRAARAFVRLQGAGRFYRALYEGNAEDLAFVDAHPNLMERCCAAMLSGDIDAGVEDIVAAFAHNPEIEEIIRRRSDVTAIRGAHTHHAPIAPALAEAERLGIALTTIEGAGRHCIYQRPDAFFAILNERPEIAAPAPARLAGACA